MATATYIPIATQTLSTAASGITFSSIPNTYTDLRLVCNYTMSVAGWQINFTFNSDTGSNYSYTYLGGNGSTANAGISNNHSSGYLGEFYYLGSSTTIPMNGTLDIFSYAGSTYKTFLMNGSNDQNGSGATLKTVNLWRNTAAITSIQLIAGSGTLSAGTTATLWGI
jgi:hypothetical protein